MVTHFAPVRFYKQTTLRTETFTQSSFYAQILLHREVCAQINFYNQTPLHRGFYAKKFYTRKVLYTDALHEGACTRMNKGTQALLHTEPFTQRNHCTEQLLHKETFTQENFDTAKMPTQTAHTSFYTPKLLRAETLPRAAFTHGNLSPAQKPLRTEVFMHSSFYTDPFTQRCIYTKKTFAHSTLLHTASFYTGRLCFLFLITCSPSQVHHGFQEKTPTRWCPIVSQVGEHSPNNYGLWVSMYTYYSL